MNTSGDAAEQVVRLSLEGFEVAARITGSGAKNVAALLYAIMKDKTKTSGKTNLNNMLKSGKELKVFSIKKENFKKFADEAKRYGVLYSALVSKRNKSNDGIIDIMVRSEDASKINRIVERFKLASFDEVTIRSEVEKSMQEKMENDKGFKHKSKDEIIKEKENSKPLQKEKESLNPHLAKTEKSPLSKPSSKVQKTSDRVTNFKERTSVRTKLNEAKKVSKDLENKKIKSEEVKHVSKKKNKERIK